jgi:alcohol dehydrogenase
MAQARGIVVMKSTVHGSVAIDSAPVIVNEVTLVGSRCGRFEPALRLLRTKQVNVASLISEILPLKNAALAFRRAATPGVLKVLLQG